MSQPKHTPPPRWASFLLNQLLPDDSQTPAGDYEEYFSSIARDHGRFAAKRWYAMQLLRLIPEIILAKLYWSFVMWKNYLLVGRRNLLKNKVSSAINLFGLSVALAACIAVFLFVKDFATVDRFHENGNRIYMVTHEVPEAGGLPKWGTSPTPLGPVLKETFPQVEESVRIIQRRALFEYGSKTISESIVFADPGFFNMFTFPLRLGQKSALDNESNVIISERTAEKYFGKSDPLGEVITLSFDGTDRQAFVVAGIAEKFPTNSGFRFDVMISANNPNAMSNTARNDWGQFVDGTFLMLTPGSEIEPILEGMASFIPVQNAANEGWQITSFDLENLRHKGVTAFLVRNRSFHATEWPFMAVFILIPLFMLALSCINYVNITLASALRRLKEIGIRKVVGGSRKQLATQFLAENIILCGLSLLVGVALAYTVLVPLFNNLFVEQIDIAKSVDLPLFVFLFAMLVGVAFISGAYPAFYISSFEPSAILRGQSKISRSAWLTRSLMTVQFAIAFITVVVSVYMGMNNQHLLNVDWGYQAENTLVVNLTGNDQFKLLEGELGQYPQIELIAGAAHHIGQGGSSGRVNVDGTEQTVRLISVGDRYFESMNIPTLEGREFVPELAGLDSTSVLVNKVFAEESGWEEAIGQSFRLDNRSVTVIGLIDNVLTNPVGADFPIVYTKSDPANYAVATLKVPSRFDIDIVKAGWEKVFPGAVLTYFYQNEVFDISYESLGKMNAMFMTIAFLSLLIACMGLFGLASQNAVTRMKEMAVRKSLGASASHLTFELNKKFILLLGVAAAISSVLCVAAINGLLSMFDTQNMPLGPLPIAVAFILLFSTAASAVFAQSRKIANINAAEVLKSE
ncbi:ABC transporter permease [bacterium]|nr:ABC transporter permease [bacterium]